MTLPFRKMHGLGNDFVVIDGRVRPVQLSRSQLERLADRRFGIGCDQIIVIEPPRHSKADAFMAIYNPDGSEAGACGNATRCVAATLMRESGKSAAVIETISGILPALAAGNAVGVNMGKPRVKWSEIPLVDEQDTLHLPLELGPLVDPVAVNMGNPHCVFFVEDTASIDLIHLGPRLEHHPLFPERTNVQIVQVIDRHTLRMRVWERGAGITLACGSGACAALVAAARRGLSARNATVQLEGGSLQIEWKADDSVWMTGAWVETFRGEWVG